MVGVFTIIAILRPNCVSYIFQKQTVVMKSVVVKMIPGVYYLNEMSKVSISVGTSHVSILEILQCSLM